MNDVSRIIFAEISIKMKDIIGVIAVFIILLFLNFAFEYAYSVTWIMSFTATSVIFETQYFKEKKNRFSILPVSRIKIFAVETFRMSVFVIFLNLLYVSILGIYDFPDNEYITYHNVINYTVGYFAVSQFIIMQRHSSNIQFNIYEKIVVRVIYTGYVIALVLLTHHMVDNYMIDVNYISFIGINFIVLGIFISLLLPANYLIFNNRGDYLK